MFITPQLKVIIVSLLATAILIVGGYFIYDALTFRITSQDPIQNDTFPTAAAIVITFNKPLQHIDNQKILISPSVAGEWLIEGTSIIFQPYEIFDETKYTVTLSQILSTNNMKYNGEFTFTASDEVGFTKEQQQRSIESTDDIEQKFSVLEKNVVPYRDSNYLIEYRYPEAAEARMILTISFTPPEYIYESQADYDAFVRENSEAAKQYLISKGINIDDYRLDFITE